MLRISREAETAGGNEYAFLHNMVTSLSLACSVLCALSAFAVVSHNVHVMVQTTSFQAIVAPGLALCGVLSYGSSAAIATGVMYTFEICIGKERWMHGVKTSAERSDPFTDHTTEQLFSLPSFVETVVAFQR